MEVYIDTMVANVEYHSQHLKNMFVEKIPNMCLKLN